MHPPEQPGGDDEQRAVLRAPFEDEWDDLLLTRMAVITAKNAIWTRSRVFERCRGIRCQTTIPATPTRLICTSGDARSVETDIRSILPYLPTR